MASCMFLARHVIEERGRQPLVEPDLRAAEPVGAGRTQSLLNSQPCPVGGAWHNRNFVLLTKRPSFDCTPTHTTLSLDATDMLVSVVGVTYHLWAYRERNT